MTIYLERRKPTDFESHSGFRFHTKVRLPNGSTEVISDKFSSPRIPKGAKVTREYAVGDVVVKSGPNVGIHSRELLCPRSGDVPYKWQNKP